MTDERNIAHDKNVAQDKKSRGEAVVEHASIVPQPGKKPALIDADTDPSNSIAHQMYKDGEEPRVHRDESDGNDAAHWQEAHSTQPYAKSEFGYEDYAPAYQLGYNSRGRYQTQSYDTLQDEMKGEWDRNRGNSRLSWEDAMPATRAAWHRAGRALPGDADGDGI